MSRSCTNTSRMYLLYIAGQQGDPHQGGGEHDGEGGDPHQGGVSMMVREVTTRR